jgi:hypothetical protein
VAPTPTPLPSPIETIHVVVTQLPAPGASGGFAWGDLATWVTGLFTAGSLLLGFSIIQKDRKKEEWSQASKVAVNVDTFTRVSEGKVPTVDRSWNFTVRMWNHSDQPIFEPRIVGFEDGHSMGLEFADGNRDRVLLPGESGSYEVSDESLNHLHLLAVAFRDSRNIEWKYSPKTGRVSKLNWEYVPTSDGGWRNGSFRPILRDNETRVQRLRRKLATSKRTRRHAKLMKKLDKLGEK